MRSARAYGFILATAFLLGTLAGCGGDGGSSGRPSSGLSPDAYELNNNTANCSGIGLDFYANDLNLHNTFDEDYFCFTLALDSFVIITVDFIHADGDLAVQLLDSFEIPIDVSQTTQNIELITKSLVAGQYYVRVYSPVGDTNTYALDIRAQSAGGPLGPDVYEPNSDTFCLVDLGDIVTPPGFNATDLTIHTATDEDYYCFNVADVTSVDINVSFFHSSGNLDVALLDSGQNVLILANTLTDDESITAILSAGTYAVHVYGVGGDMNRYALDVSGTTGGGSGPDLYEPNEDPTTCGGSISDFGDATGITSVPTFEAQASIHTITDQDYYCFTLTQTSNVIIDLRFTHLDGNLDMELMDDQQTILDFGVTINDNERVIRNLGPGSYGIHVFGFGGATNTYDLSIIVLELDPYEPNDDSGTCVPVPSFPWQNPNPPGELTIHDAADEDYFCISIPGPTDYDVRIDCLFEHWIGDLDIDLLDSQLISVIWSQTRDDDETIQATLPPGNFYLRVFGFGGAMNRYDLLITGSPSSGGLGQDVYEPNNTPAAGVCTPVNLTFDSLVAAGQNLTIHNSADSDYFCFSMNGSGNRTVTVDLRYLAVDGDLDVELYTDPSGTPRLIGRAETATDNELLTAVVPAGGAYQYAVRVYGYKGDTNTYDLIVSAVNGGGLAEDNWESNDDFLTPNPQWLSEASFPTTPVLGRTLHNSIDEDFIQFEVSQPLSVKVDLTFTLDCTVNPINCLDIDLAILDDNGDIIAIATSGTNNESIEVNVADGIQYRIWVFGFLGAINTYDFAISYGPPIPPAPDAFEPNNDLATARPIGLPASLADLSIHDPATDDYYKVNFRNPDILTVSLGFTHALGNLDLELLDATGALLDSSTSTFNSEEITYNVLPGDYIIHVFSPTANWYRMDVFAAAGGGGLQPDGYELNDDLNSCVPIPFPFQEPNLSIHDPTDLDYFCLTTTGTNRITIELRFIHALGDVDVSLWCIHAGSGPAECQGTLVGSSSSWTDNELITYDGSRGITIQAGEYYILVETAFGGTNYYEMYVWNY